MSAAKVVLLLLALTGRLVAGGVTDPPISSTSQLAGRDVTDPLISSISSAAKREESNPPSSSTRRFSERDVTVSSTASIPRRTSVTRREEAATTASTSSASHQSHNSTSTSSQPTVLVVTATTGTPPPTVTFTPAQDTKKTGLKSQTTSDGTLFFPLGWFWAPVTPPPGGPPLPPTLPPIPTTATPPKTTPKTTEKTTDKTTDKTTKTSDDCTSTTTPTATIVISYSDKGNGAWSTITKTNDPKDATGSCKGKVATATSTVSPSSIAHWDFTGSVESNPYPTDFPDPKQAVLKYLDDEFKSLDFIETASSTSKPSSTSKASSTTQASPTPSAVSCDQKTVDDTGSDNKPKDYPKSAYQAGAHQFCFGGYDWTAKGGDRYSASNYFWFDTDHTDPDTKLPAYCIGSAKGSYDQWSPESRKYCKGGSGLDNSNSKVWYEVVPSADQKGCKPIKDYKLPSNQDCVNCWDKVINQCMKDHGTSGIYREETDNGCWEWRTWGRTLT